MLKLFDCREESSKSTFNNGGTLPIDLKLHSSPYAALLEPVLNEAAHEIQITAGPLECPTRPETIKCWIFRRHISTKPTHF
jgi:hypothetical protein